ncbi:hypothetical protein X975_06342, partial [Stegodyphus mimosarum]
MISKTPRCDFLPRHFLSILIATFACGCSACTSWRVPRLLF